VCPAKCLKRGRSFDIGATLRDTLANAARQIRRELDAIERRAVYESVETLADGYDHLTGVSPQANL